MARRFARRGTKTKHNNVWTAVVIEDVLVTTTTLLASIVTPDEWQASSSGFKHGTLLRIRGWLSLARNEAVDASGTTFMAIYVEDQETAQSDPSLVTTYNEEDVLWSAGVILAAKAAASVEQAPSHQFIVDVKAMRRIDSGQAVKLVLVSSTVNLLRVSGVLRGLVRVDS